MCFVSGQTLLNLQIFCKTSLLLTVYLFFVLHFFLDKNKTFIQMRIPTTFLCIVFFGFKPGL